MLLKKLYIYPITQSGKDNLWQDERITMWRNLLNAFKRSEQQVSVKQKSVESKRTAPDDESRKLTILW